jgi:hypothetical protein
MKIRTGFVSNSSTSSFCIYGTDFDYITVKTHSDERDIEKYAKKFGLEAYHDNCDWYVGLSWDSIGDDETGLEFKQRIKESVQKFLGDIDDVKCGSIERAWYDG